VICSETADGHFLASLGGGAAHGAYQYLKGSIDQNAHRDPQQLLGIFRAMLYRHPDLAAAGLGAEVDSFRQSRTQLEGFRNDLIAFQQTITVEMTEWKNSQEAGVTAWFTESRQAAIDDRARSSGDFAAALQEWAGKVQALEVVYRDKLQLEGPVQYWKDLEDEYTRSRRIWVWWSIGAVTVLAAATGLVLYWPPPLLTAKDVSQGVRGALLVGVALSVAVYVIHLFVRLATSCFHLARDARERRQLTTVFLSLVKDGTVADTDRQLIPYVTLFESRYGTSQT
jgi:hypothetical protein